MYIPNLCLLTDTWQDFRHQLMDFTKHLIELFIQIVN